jgi:nicotinamidase-related amidase
VRELLEIILGLRFGELGAGAVHLCVDMQRIFADETAWHTPWMDRVLPNIVAITDRRPERTIFTRFIPLRNADEGPGTWRRYYQRWPTMTLDTLAPGMTDLVPELEQFVPPAWVVDKRVYSPWITTDLHPRLRQAGIDTLIITGGETEVCVMATMIGAIDLGYRVVLVTDALCSSADETHEAMLRVYESRFGMQMETAANSEVLDAWR